MTKSGQQQRESLESFMVERIRTNPLISIEALLEEYIEKHNLAVRHYVDEPKHETSARTILQVLEESSLVEECNDPQFMKYLSGLRYLVQMYDTLLPQARKLMKEREDNI